MVSGEGVRVGESGEGVGRVVSGEGVRVGERGEGMRM